MTAEDLRGLRAYEVAALLATDAGVAPPATAKTLPPALPTERAAFVRQHSRRQFGRPKAIVEAEILARQTQTHENVTAHRRRRP